MQFNGLWAGTWWNGQDEKQSSLNNAFELIQNCFPDCKLKEETESMSKYSFLNDSMGYYITKDERKDESVRIMGMRGHYS